MKKILIIVSVIIGLIIIFALYRTFLAPDVYVMNGESMNPTYSQGDILKTDKDLANINRGTVVDISVPTANGGSAELIKRIVGLPGEQVAIKDGDIYINGDLITVPPIPTITYKTSTSTGTTNTEPIKLGINQYYVLGDNPLRSLDSRSFGPISLNQINVIVLGKY